MRQANLERQKLDDIICEAVRPDWMSAGEIVDAINATPEHKQFILRAAGGRPIIPWLVGHLARLSKANRLKPKKEPKTKPTKGYFNHFWRNNG